MELGALVAETICKLLAVLLDTRRQRTEVLDGFRDGLHENQVSDDVTRLGPCTHTTEQAHSD